MSRLDPHFVCDARDKPGEDRRCSSSAITVQRACWGFVDTNENGYRDPQRGKTQQNLRSTSGLQIRPRIPRWFALSTSSSLSGDYKRRGLSACRGA